MGERELQAIADRLDRIERLLTSIAQNKRKPLPGAVSLSKAAALLGVSRCRTLPDLISSGAIRTVEIAGRVRVPRSEIERALLNGVAASPAGRARRRSHSHRLPTNGANAGPSGTVSQREE